MDLHIVRHYNERRIVDHSSLGWVALWPDTGAAPSKKSFDKILAKLRGIAGGDFEFKTKDVREWLRVCVVLPKK
jgi:hypothetical protein